MDCQTCETLTEAYADGELDAAQAVTLEQHLEKCPACRQAYAQIQSLRRVIRQKAPYFNAPAGLAEKITANLSERSQSSPSLSAGRLQQLRPTAAPQNTSHSLPTRLRRSWAGLGLAAACALLLSTNIILYRHQSAGAPLARELVDDHVRSLMVSHLTDIPSSDQHTVKPWFNGKLDFSPPVNDLKGQGFPLAGGRLDIVRGQPAAVLVYYRNRHPVNLFIWPVQENRQSHATLSHERGYNLVHWNANGMAFWAVSDLNSGELMQFAHLVTRQLTTGDPLP